jgi:hypothetical protein
MIDPTTPLTPDLIDRDAILDRFWAAGVPAHMIPVAEAAARMGTTPAAIWSRQYRGTLPYELVLFGGRAYVHESDIEAAQPGSRAA